MVAASLLFFLEKKFCNGRLRETTFCSRGNIHFFPEYFPQKGGTVSFLEFLP